ncbi:SDR family oxidoreductase [Salininema proteolyticum]|uniref:SDR family oxidoreductase n=1 Tax=Salininema proteolyticum TaxID=1607685 RepID=A0ABV8U535_9ACTN
MIAITGATGNLGRLSIAELIRRGTDPSDIRALVRDPESARDLDAQGVTVVRADYDEPDGLPEALKGAEKLLFISGSEIGRRVPQHRNVIEAAQASGTEFIAYTSLLRADTSRIGLAAEHRATEALLADSGIPHTLLRNGWYLENYTENLGPSLHHGVHLGSAGEGRVSAASRADYAAAAVEVLTGSGHEGEVYELAGDRSFTYAEMVAEVSRARKTALAYRDMDSDGHRAALAEAGVPEDFAALLADWDAGVKRGDLFAEDDALHRLIGRDTTSLAEAVARM